MNQNLHSPTKLTEFARDFDDEPETLFGRFVFKIQNVYNQSYNTTSSSSNNNTPTTTTVKIVDSTNKESPSISHSSSTSSMSGAIKQQPPKTLPIETSAETNTTSIESNMEQTEARTMVNVLKRISNLMASKNNDLRNYKDTDLHKFWMPDSKAKECYDCTQRFNTFRRKHHCRLCGQIFCSKCCNQVVPGKIILCSGDLKVCNYCSKIVLSYLKSPNITKDLQSDLQALQQDLTNKLEEVENTIPVSVDFSPRKMSVGYQEERFATQHSVNNLSEIDRKSILQQSNSLITLQQEMFNALPAQNCGLDLIEFLNVHNKSSNKMQAIAILSAMLAAGFIQPIVPDSEEMDFDENLHYKFINISKQNVIKYSDLSQTHVTTQFNVSANEPQPPKSIEHVSLTLQTTQEAEMENSMRSTTTTSKLLESYCDHEEQLLAQMLRFSQLDLYWSKVLLPLCCRAANHFKPEYCTNDLMDIRNYVNFKKVPGGKRQECTIVGGVVFSKNVAHKDMAARVEMPRVLLLQCAIVYERIEGKFVSISTVLLQEKEYLRNVCKRIMSFQPNVVLVHKNVAGVAQDILRSQGVTLVLDVKLSVLERLARTLQCDIITSIESNISKPRLGLCDAFYIQSFNDGTGSSKTLMFFEKLNSPRGYTCLLRGSNNAELKKVKKVAAFLVYARYNWRLEMSFLLDEFAQSQQPNGVVFDSKESSPKSLMRQEVRALALKAEKKDLENVPVDMDPLRSDATVLPDVQEMELEVETRYDNRFRNALSSTILSISPFVVFPLPYLETEQGRKCALRKLFPKELYYSKQWSSQERIDSTVEINNNQCLRINETHLNPPHDFLTLKITTPSDERRIQSLLAEFRALGCRYRKRNDLFKIQLKEQEEVQPQKASDEHIYKDALDLENHQRLPVLFCSFYFNQKTGSSFCAPPTLLDMKFYGHQDIMLGQFLQRYCCRLSSICTLCNLPMLNHVRRYVHSMGCVQVFLSEDSMKTDPNRIFFTAWCSICNEVTPSVPLSETSKCLSLAKYLELRFHAHSYKKRALSDESTTTSCQHSLQRDYVHYFSFRGVGAKFQYTNIEVWEIGLPALKLQLQQPKALDHFQLLEDVKNFSTKGHEIFTRIHERIADLAIDDENSPLVANLKQLFSKDQLHFKRHVEAIQTTLTEANVRSYKINDAVIMAKHILAECLELWTPRLQEIATAQKLALKQQHQSVSAPLAAVEPPTDTGDESLTNEGEDSNDDAASSSGILTTAAEKKSIKQMFSQLLPSTAPAISLQSPYSKEEHYKLPLGAFPVLVHDHDLSSVIAYSLVSHDYQRALNNLTQTNNNSASVIEKDSENVSAQEIEQEIKQEVIGSKGSNNNSSTTNVVTLTGSDEERGKLKTHNSFIDIVFQDNQTHFSCRIYFAKEFDMLRSKTLKPYELKKEDTNQSNIEASRYALARSLSSSVQWEARGGKSGSRFCKTLDDRFVLKEMSKGDVNIFENFAPNYFEYIAKSQQQNEPTLLAKIFGVFKVSIKKKDFVQEKSLLVMENLFYNLDIKNKFDLKGSERNRLVNPTEQDGETVLLDENLVQMSWLKPLYILSHSKVVLKNAITRDSTFLEKNQVMDYSLLVGLDHDHNTLVLGIIDYIRTFTFDKKLESFVKQTGILGGGLGKLPTVISPERYKLRFIDAMDRYFYTVPDRWEGLSKS